MFGGKSKHVERLMAKRQWDKVNKMMESADSAEKIEIAEACSAFRDSESLNLLVLLIMDKAEPVQLAAIQSMAKVGNDSSVTRLRWLLGRLTPEQEPLKGPIRATILAIDTRK